MAWSASKVFSSLVIDVFGNTTAVDLDTDVPKVALYDNDVTPDETAASASTAYNTGAWTIAGNEVSETTEWPAGGRPLVSTTWAASGATGSRVAKYDAADTSSAGATADLANVYGCLVYDDTLAAVVVDQGLCYNYFGGVQSVTNGTFTVVWHANGIFRFTF